MNATASLVKSNSMPAGVKLGTVVAGGAAAGVLVTATNAINSITQNKINSSSSTGNSSSSSTSGECSAGSSGVATTNKTLSETNTSGNISDVNKSLKDVGDSSLIDSNYILSIKNDSCVYSGNITTLVNSSYNTDIIS